MQKKNLAILNKEILTNKCKIKKKKGTDCIVSILNTDKTFQNEIKLQFPIFCGKILKIFLMLLYSNKNNGRNSDCLFTFYISAVAFIISN